MPPTAGSAAHLSFTCQPLWESPPVRQFAPGPSHNDLHVPFRFSPGLSVSAHLNLACHQEPAEIPISFRGLSGFPQQMFFPPLSGSASFPGRIAR